MSAFTVLGTDGDMAVNKPTCSHGHFILTGGDTLFFFKVKDIVYKLVSNSDVCYAENIKRVFK